MKFFHVESKENKSSFPTAQNPAVTHILGFLDGLDGVRVVRRVEDGGACHDGIAARVLDQLGVGTAGTAIDLDPRVNAFLFAHGLQVPGRSAIPSGLLPGGGVHHGESRSNDWLCW